MRACSPLVWCTLLAAACATGTRAPTETESPSPSASSEASTEASHEAGHGHGSETSRKYLRPEEGPGVIQSPVNILTSAAQEGAAKVRLHYGEAKEETKNLGHTVQVSFVDKTNWVEFDGDRFELLQFHFHTPSEHLVDGVTYPMEMHLVHRKVGTENQYLVIGVLFKEGAENPLIQAFLDEVPELEGQAGPTGVIDLGPFIRPDEGFYAYRGSLTTPPYTETVRWYVSKEVQVASPEQVEHIYRLEGDNARHIQVFRGRRLSTD